MAITTDVHTQTPPPRPMQGRARKKGGWGFLAVLLLLGGVAALVYLYKPTRPYVLAAVESAKHLIPATPEAPTGPPTPLARFDNKPWDRLIRIAPDQAESIGLRLINVKEAKLPMKLELNATTAYDPDTLTQIRLRFDSLVNRVHKKLGDRVSKGDPLVDLYSNELAAAKSDYQVKYVQWLHDHKLYDQRELLVKDNSISKLTWTETVNAESKSWLDYQLAYDKLGVYGLSEEEITPLLHGLNEQSLTALARQKEGVAEKAHMTLRSPAAGMVIKRDVVPGTYYEPSSVLMVIAPLDHFRVYANVYESDLELVQNGQALDVEFPYQDRTIPTKVDGIANQVDPDTHAMRIRATIKNPGDLKADMLVRAVLHIEPYDGDTVIPRNVLVTTNNKYYVFVKRPSAADSGAQPVSSGTEKHAAEPEVFERREVRIRQERNDQVIVSDGLRKGEEAAGTGSLILAQMYEDLATVDSGAPP